MSDKVLKRRVILIGKTGSGKSSTGNILLRNNYFPTKMGFTAGTQNCDAQTGNVEFGHSHYDYTVVDTPGLFDSETPLAKTALKIQSSTLIHCQNPHAFLLVFKTGRFTNEDKFMIDMLRIIFGEKIYNYIIVVVTHGNDFKSDEDLKRQVREHPALSQLVDKCGKRLVRIENVATDTDCAPDKIFKAIELLSKNGSLTYSYANINRHTQALGDHLANYEGPDEIPHQVEALVKTLGKTIPVWIPVCLGLAVSGAAGYAVATGDVKGAAAGATAWVTTHAPSVATSVGDVLVGVLQKIKFR